MRTCLLIIVMYLVPGADCLQAQFTICTAPGQHPNTAIPICNTQVFTQNKLSICRNANLFVPGCTDSRTEYGDKNPFYLKITCVTSGTIAFIITPNIITDDFNWQLYDITDHNPTDIFTDKSLIVTGNWSGSSGLTGASPTGVNFIQCGYNLSNEPKPTFSTMPELLAGHVYLLMVSQQDDNSTNGFSFQVTGGTANIADALIPSLKSLHTSCNSKEITVTINKKILCSSIDTNGSDFILSPSNAAIVNVSSLNCSASADTDSLLIKLDNPLPAGNYFLTAKIGTDNNTVADRCGNELTVDEQLSFSIYQPGPDPLDSILPLNCQPDKIDLFFRKNISCSSIAPDGTDFIITGSTPVTITGASGICNGNGTSSIIEITLTQAINGTGNYTISLKSGTDGNTLIDECGFTAAAGQTKNFVTKGTVNAGFIYSINQGCKEDTVLFSQPGSSGINSWKWTFENGDISNLQNPQFIYSTQGIKPVTLVVSNGSCADTTTQNLLISEKLKASFTAPVNICPEDAAIFTDASIKATTWHWDFDNGITSNLQNPFPQTYPLSNSDKNYTIELIASDGICFDTTTRKITVAQTCTIAVPGAFTPNHDGINDFLYPLNAFKADNLDFKVFNRTGQLVFKTTDWKIKWDGTINGTKQPTGTYVWYLKYKNRDTGKNMELKGTTVLIR